MQADYVIVGSGSAGAALAYRLGEAGHSVIVIEAGGTDAGPFIQMPGALSYPMNMPRYDWGFMSEPEPNLGNRRMVVPRGKVIGGSSSVNGMVWVRGHSRDFDHWQEMGATGWSGAHVRPYFKRLEHYHGDGPTGWRGSDGPLHVRQADQWNPLSRAFVEAGREAGYPVTPDYNGEQQEGFAAFDMSVHRGRRWSTANAYLKPALARFNVRLVQAQAQRVTFDGTRATGVEVAHRAEKTKVIHARREVILSASSINTPKLMMLSGIGPAAHLAEHGITPLVDRPGVGQNLQDHLEVYLQYAARQPITLYRYWNLLGKAWAGARWLATRTGLGASNQFESCAFIRSTAGVDYPDIQMHFLPIAVRYDGKAAAEGHGFQAHVGPMRSASRGAVTLASPDPAAAPRIRFNYMSSETDWQDFRTALRLTREVFRQPAMAEHVAHEIQPGSGEDDTHLDAFIREHAESAYHPCGTARMGAADDPLAVVDPEARVIGTQGLRVADSSIFPRITNGNTNAPSIMVGEKVADHILGRALPPDETQPWLHPDWQNKQR